MKLSSITKKPAFTLVEMLVVVAIIGLLATAILPRVIGMQARARDVARDSDLRLITMGINAYKLEHDKFPTPQYTAFEYTNRSLYGLIIPQAYAQSLWSSIDGLDPKIQEYFNYIPKDPNNKGIKAMTNWWCIQWWSSYAYYTNPAGSLFSVTSIAESKKWNASACGDTIDHYKDGAYKKYWQGLKELQLTQEEKERNQWATQIDCFGLLNGTIISYKASCPKNVIIPYTIRGERITAIGNSVFQSQNITSVEIPSSITSIGNLAFYGNNLSSLTLPDSLQSIGNQAFQYNRISQVTIPNSVTAIGSNAFSNNNNLAVTFLEGRTSIPNSAFQSNQIASVVIPSTVTSIGNLAFYDNRLTSLTLPDSLQSIGNQAFQYNRISQVTIPNSVNAIGSNAFANNTIGANIPYTSATNARGTWIVQGSIWVKQ